jgi:hypothetical protein
MSIESARDSCSSFTVTPSEYALFVDLGAYKESCCGGRRTDEADDRGLINGLPLHFIAI